jgi:purine-binding chemotaxis protein CheW
VSANAKHAFDWDAVRARIAGGIALTEHGDASPERGGDLLRERARALARAPGQDLAGTMDAVEVLAFELGGARYAVESSHVLHACAWSPLTALPGLPNHVAGIMAFRGRVLAVLDLRALLALPVTRLVDPAALIVLQDSAMEFALLADAVAGVCHYPHASLSASLPGLGSLRAGYLMGVAPDRTAILDGSRLLGDRSLALQAQ